MGEVSVAPTFRMSRELQNLSGGTNLWLVSLNLDLLSGYTIWGGDDPDRFLTVDGRLVIAPSVSELLAGLPPAGCHPFAGDERFTTFCRRIREIDLVDAHGGDDSGLYDRSASLPADHRLRSGRGLRPVPRTKAQPPSESSPASLATVGARWTSPGVADAANGAGRP